MWVIFWLNDVIDDLTIINFWSSLRILSLLSRARKAAAEDDLNTANGTLETLNNNVNSLATEGTE